MNGGFHSTFDDFVVSVWLLKKWSFFSFTADSEMFENRVYFHNKSLCTASNKCKTPITKPHFNY